MNYWLMKSEPDVFSYDDLVKKGKMPGHTLSGGDIVLFASVGAGMNINAIVYRV